MPEKMINVKVFRFDPTVDLEPSYKSYVVPFEKGMSALTALDYIYQNLDGTLSYYDHAGCDLGICGRCTGKIDGQPGLFCQTVIQGDVVLEPTLKDRVIKDLVVKRSGEKRD